MALSGKYGACPSLCSVLTHHHLRSLTLTTAAASVHVGVGTRHGPQIAPITIARLDLTEPDWRSQDMYTDASAGTTSTQYSVCVATGNRKHHTPHWHHDARRVRPRVLPPSSGSSS